MDMANTALRAGVPAGLASGRRYHRGINGLRGILATHVVLVHFLMAFLPSSLTSFDAVMFPAEASPHWIVPLLQLPVLSLFISGHFTVTSLFVLSGYVLTMPYFSGRNDRLYVSLWGRYIRLTIPMALSIILSLLLYKSGLFFNHEAAAVSKSIALNMQLPGSELTVPRAAKEITYYGLLTGLSFFNFPLWTIKYEFIGSILVLALYICMPPRHRIFPILGVSFVICFAFGATSVFIMGVFAGSLLNFVTLPRGLRPVLFVLGIYFGTYIPNHAEYAWLPVVFTDPTEAFFNVSFYDTIGSVCLVGAVVAGFAEGLLSHRLLQWLGSIAYSMYLLHLLVLCSLASFLYLVLPKTDLCLLLILLVYMATIMAVATPYTRYVDETAIRWARRFGAWLCDIAPTAARSTPAAAAPLRTPASGTGVAD
ncbi:MAG: acyltransferase family protein [Acetobacteraceae bacterium]|nr:acyltransferase family protein [Acetobacteraceae bacterium]